MRSNVAGSDPFHQACNRQINSNSKWPTTVESHSASRSVSREFARRCGDFLRVRQKNFFERRRVWNWRVKRSDSQDRPVKFIEYIFANERGNFAGHAAGTGVFVNDEKLVGFFHGARIVSLSRGSNVRRSTTSTSIPSFASVSAASSDVCTIAA